MITSRMELARELVALEKKYDIQLKAIREFMAPLQPGRESPIGFALREEK